MGFTIGQTVQITGGKRWGLHGVIVEIHRILLPPLMVVAVRLDGQERVTNELASNLKPRADE